MFFKLFEKSLFIWFCWVFMAARAFLSLQVRAALQLRCTGFSLWWLLLLWSTGSGAHGLQSLWPTGSVVVAPGLQSIGSILVAHRRGCPMAYEIFPDHGSNLCLMHWQADSLPLSHQGSPLQFLLLLLTFSFLFYFGVQLINKVMSVSVVQQSDSVIHTHVSSLFQILFPFRLSQNIKQRSLCYIIGPCWLCFKQSSVHMSVPNS